MKTIKDAVIELGGVLPEEVVFSGYCTLAISSGYFLNSEHIFYIDHAGSPPVVICSKESFQSEAKSMGYINEYLWGNKYHCNGERPSLPKDVKVSCKIGGVWRYDDDYSDDVDYWNWSKVQAFKVLDPRYKPADEVSEIERLGIQPPMNKNERCGMQEQKSSWHERGVLPPVGAECEYTIGDNFGGFKPCYFAGLNSRGSLVIEKEDGEFKCFHKHQIKLRPIRTHREKVIEAAVKIATAKAEEVMGMKVTSNECFNECLAEIFDAGMLNLPNP